ncbi:DUF1877 family protein [Streptomyces sp. NPDC017993]|uniref:DUF1877 family protein n=1 Tax=Streptomyces sp. NPDC017993 TaxID=3365027 RepID=UPI0037ABA50B
MSARPYGGPDKAWAGLQFLLDEADVGLEFLMDGFQILEDGTLFGWSAEQVESLARQLRATQWEQLAVHCDPERMAQERGCPADALGSIEYAYEEPVAFTLRQPRVDTGRSRPSTSRARRMGGQAGCWWKSPSRRGSARRYECTAGISEQSRISASALRSNTVAFPELYLPLTKSQRSRHCCPSPDVRRGTAMIESARLL